LQALYAEVGIAEANLVQAGRVRNPRFTFSRIAGGDALEIERKFIVDIVSLLSAPLFTRIERGGALVHEMVLGTPDDIAEHAELMRRFPNIEHDEEYQLHVQPRTTGDMVWQFNRAGVFKFACLVPGHYEAGMQGKIIVLDERGGQRLSRGARSARGV